jgi:TRAP-type C4-dicarboxylate transport system permease small subunit
MLKRLAMLELAIASLLLCAIVLLVLTAAIMRFFGYPLIWSMDMAQLLFIWLCFFGAARGMRERAHLGIDILVRWLNPTARLRLEFGVSLVILTFLMFLAIEGYQLTLLNTQRVFGDSGLSYAFVTSAVPVGCLMIAIALVRNMVSAAKRGTNGAAFIYSRDEHRPTTPEA